MPHIKINNNTGEDFSSLYGLIEQFFPFAKKQLNFNKPVQVTLRSDLDNANNFFGKTAHYDPSIYEVVIYTDNRHPKDIMRSLSHELVHHAQNCNGQFENAEPTQEGYAQKNPHLREMEQDAFLRGNMIFRDWCDFTQTNDLEETNYKSKKGDNLMNENSIRNLVRHTLQKVLAKSSLAQGTDMPQESPEEVSETVDDDQDFLAEIEAELDENCNCPDLMEEEKVEEAGRPHSMRGGRTMADLDKDAKTRETDFLKKKDDDVGEEKLSKKQKEKMDVDDDGDIDEEDLKEEKPLKEWYDNSLYNKLLKEYTRRKK
jgi:hypothetical protein